MSEQAATDRVILEHVQKHWDLRPEWVAEQLRCLHGCGLEYIDGKDPCPYDCFSQEPCGADDDPD